MATPPGPDGLPVVGSVARFARDPFGFMTAVGRAYGDVARFPLGREEFYMLTAPDDIEAVLVNTEQTYRKAEFGSDAAGRLLGEGLLLSGGTAWRERRQLLQPAFAGDRMPEYGDVITRHARSMVADWVPGQTINLQRELSRVTVEIIADAMFGVSLGDDTVRTLQEALVPLGRRFEPDPLRAVLPDWLPTPEGRRFDDALRTLDEIVSGIAARGDTHRERETALSILQAARRAGRLSREDLRDELVTLLLAGHDTTALALTYAFHLLSEHPAVDRRLDEELRQVLDGEPPTHAVLDALGLTERVVTEALRLYPPVYAIFRQPTVDVTIGGYHIPRGSTLMLPQWVVHRSSAHYRDPERFEPDRWEPERAADRHPYAYFPFGGGPRACIGRQLAMVEATLLLATVGREYRLVGDGGSIDLLASITMHPRDPVEMRVEPR